jgi:antitoxin component of MazEF toxin-antitoxin module
MKDEMNEAVFYSELITIGGGSLAVTLPKKNVVDPLNIKEKDRVKITVTVITRVINNASNTDAATNS